MPLYRGSRAEVRRIHRDAAWVLTGVVVDDHWYAMSARVQPASIRHVEAGLIGLIELPDFIALDDRKAAATAKYLAIQLGYPTPSAVPARDVLLGPRRVAT